MSVAIEMTPVPADAADLAPYRAISRAAILSAVMAALSLPIVALALVSMKFEVGDAFPLGIMGAIFAAAAFILGFSGWRTVRRYPTEYTGLRLAKSGLIGGLVLLIAGASAAAVTYATEVPEGYSRISFWELQPDPDQPDLPIAPKALEISGQPIFIKGYMHPGVSSLGKVNHFILVRDMGTCCFGGQPKPTDMIEVYIPDGKPRVAYSLRKLKLAGTFMLTDRPTQSLGLSGVWYHLEADQVK